MLTFLPISATYGINWCKALETVRTRIFPKPLEMSEVIWPAETLSQVQFKNLIKFCKKMDRPLQKNSIINLLKYEELPPVVESDVGFQRVVRNTAFENQLIKESNINEKPREVLTFRLHLENGQIIETPIKKTGNVNDVDFSSARYELFELLRGSATGIAAIEVAHTHPTYVTRVVDPVTGKGNIRTNVVSVGDVQTIGSELAMTLPRGKRVIIKAIVPNGFYYQLELATGR